MKPSTKLDASLILALLAEKKRGLGVQEMMKALNLSGPHKNVLRQILKDLCLKGRLSKQGRRFYLPEHGMPNATTNGKTPKEVLGIFHPVGSGGLVTPCDKRNTKEYAIAPKKDGSMPKARSLVTIAVTRETRHGCHGRLLAVHHEGNNPLDPALISLLEHNIPHVFPHEVHESTRGLEVPPLAEREDLRDIPFVTIDGEDAKDFDDAVYVAPNPHGEGWSVWVAIADVAHYVTPGNPLDQEARHRGNSVYFPNKVVPMLPEALSNHLCSLRPNEDRACMAVRLWVNAQGHLEAFRFTRGLMRSRARLTYGEVQEGLDKGEKLEKLGDLTQTLLPPLKKIHGALRKARKNRGALDLDRQEIKVTLNAAHEVTAIGHAPHYESHEIIEELMILANQAALFYLTHHHIPSLFRVHEHPDPLRIKDLQAFYKTIDLPMKRAQVFTGQTFNTLLSQAKDTPYYEIIQDLILRTQAKAVYDPDNIGHFGLALPCYGHFTSPIRRYADLIVHRGVAACLQAMGSEKMAFDPKAAPPVKAPVDREGLDYQETFYGLKALGYHLSDRERTAAQAERDTMARYVASYYQGHLQEVFPCVIVGVTSFGLFLSIQETQAQGMVPFHGLPDDHFYHHESLHALIGRRTGQVFALGDRVQATLDEADPVTGRMRFSLVMPKDQPKTPRKKKRRGG